MKRLYLIILFAMCVALSYAHPSFELHREDFYAVLGLREDWRIDEWMRMISSDMIDNHRGKARKEYGGLDFYDYLKREFPGFKCNHRLLFHWGYNVRPWTKELEKKIITLDWARNPNEVKRFQQALVNEQRYRNRRANEMTERLFGFASGGKEAGYANAIISIVYDTHIIGDYMTDNKRLSGMQEFGSVVGDLINAIRRIDEPAGRELIKSLQRMSREKVVLTAVQRAEGIKEVQVRADKIMVLMKRDFPRFIQSAQGGAFAKRLILRKY